MGSAAIAASLVAAFAPTFSFAQGGPPMVTDDPGTPGNTHWEINIASLGTFAGGEQLLQAPYLDINYGWGERTQLKLETGWAFLKSGSMSSNGSDIALVGVKWRFLDENQGGIAISTYPQFQFHVFSETNPELTIPGNLYILPLEFSKTLGQWEINPEIGYLIGTASPNQFFGGVVLAYEGFKPLELLAEVHLNADTDGTGTLTLLNLGMRYTFNPEMNLLAAIGHSVTAFDGTPEELDTYLGLQLEL